ncbi:MAG: hypothetical protein K9L75_04295 [Spirochaetia bacterium]|nr:hypothetical protein [Spirochaetia bacterium]
MYADAEKHLEEVIQYILNLDLGERQRITEERHRAALQYESVDRLPIIFSYPLEGEDVFQPFPNSSIYSSHAAMMHNELVSAWGQSIVCRDRLADDLPLTIRPNWGTVTVASLFGFPPEQRDEQTPWIKRTDEQFSLEDALNTAADIENNVWVNKVIESYEFYHEQLRRYPELAELLTITLPDLQGPLDSLEQVMGQELFIDMLTRPELVQEALMKTAELQLKCMKRFQPYVTEGMEGFSHQHGVLLKGNILIRNDSVVMISSEIYRELVKPADDYVLQEVNGGGIHSCGKFDHTAEAMLDSENLQSLDFGQPYMNDIDAIYKKAEAKKVPLLRIQPKKEDLLSGRIMEKYPTGVSLLYHAESLREARKLFEAYAEASEKIS